MNPDRLALVLLATCTVLASASVVISEVMINPVADYGDPSGTGNQYVELYNSSSRAVSLCGWSLKDLHREECQSLITNQDQTGWLLPACRALILSSAYQGRYDKRIASHCRPETLLVLQVPGQQLCRYGLHRRQGAIGLFDNHGNCVSRFNWQQECAPGTSWERAGWGKDAVWQRNAGGGTPGYANDCRLLKQVQAPASDSCWSISGRCVRDGSGESTPLLIRILSKGSQRFRITIHDLSGRQIRCLLDDVLPAGHWQFCWYGKDSKQQAVPSGVYVALLKRDRDNSDRQERKPILVIRRY